MDGGRIIHQKKVEKGRIMQKLGKNVSKFFHFSQDVDKKQVVHPSRGNTVDNFNLSKSQKSKNKEKMVKNP